MLTEDHKWQRVDSSHEFLRRYGDEKNNFLDSIVTGDETWAFHFTPETKQQSREWWHPSSPKPRKFKQTQSAGKVMATVFWDRKGVLLIDFLPAGTTVNADRYCETLKKLRRAIQNRRRWMLSNGVSILHDNARPHVARQTVDLLQNFG
ncbi:histone-lysine N-methyltransferase SETMAR-like [Stegodyphus dumicola]|uniref:histone-lysine N-methyltransferase SETMAR-like n=1 Tax=Stegodyphus dumicola TaxID=202533 RepID=UPI0015B26A7D|nr:histone-lysine N-methyltransferase SETMAR-like [Stegodyphus dumicola]